MEIFNNSNGLFLFESDHSDIVDSKIFNNGYGVRVYRSSYVTITYSTIQNNGVGISLATSSKDNYVHHCDIIENEVSASDGNIGNVWDDFKAEGNYWSDYTGTDMDNDGIGDQPYVISNTSQDNYPLVDQFNIILKILSIDPENDAVRVSQNTSVNITFSEQLDRSSVAGNIVISPEIQIQGYKWYDNDRKVELILPTLNNGTTYYVNVSTKITNLTGKGLKFPYSYRFTTIDPFNDIRPYVVDHFPDGFNVPITTFIRINFSFSMQRESVENAVTFKPDIEVNVEWVNDKVVIFRPALKLDNLVLYTVGVSVEAINVIGNSLEDHYIFTFTTEFDHYPPEVISYSPSGIEIAPINLDKITVEFDEPVYTNSVENRFEILPPVSGYFDWDVSNQKMYYYLEDELLYNQIYTVKLLPGLMDEFGNPTDTTYDFNFRTVPGINPMDLAPYIVDIFPTGENIVDVGTDYLFVAFSETVDTGSVEERFNIYPPTNGSFDWKNSNRTMYYEFDSDLLYNVTYTFKIWSGIMDLEGNPTNKTYEFWFVTEPGVSPFKVMDYSPVGSKVPVDSEIQIIFNKYANQTSVENGFAIAPEVDGKISWNQTTLIFTPGLNLSYNETFQVSLEDNVIDTTGVKISNPLVWNFRTMENKTSDNGGKPNNGDNETPPNGNETDEPEDEDDEPDYTVLIIAVVILVVLIFILIFFFMIRDKKYEEPEPEEPVEKRPKSGGGQVRERSKGLKSRQDKKAGRPPKKLDDRRSKDTKPTSKKRDLGRREKLGRESKRIDDRRKRDYKSMSNRKGKHR
jgi:parallel beta-helix repeat protein